MRSVLIVDDDDELAETLQEFLELQEFSVLRVSKASVALHTLSQRQFDLMLLDWQLDDMPGIDLLKQYRQAGGNARVLMLTGMRDAQSRQLGTEAGADDFLTKPFTVDQLLERLGAIFR